MPFQFYCPQGHLLEGHESQAGQQSQCPLCGTVFVMPTIPGAPLPAAGVPGQPTGWPGYTQPAAGYPQHPGYAPGFGQPGPVYGQPGVPGYPMYPGAHPGYAPGYPAAPGQPGVPPGYGQLPMQAPEQFNPQAAAFAGHPGAAAPGGFPGNQEPGLPVIKTDEEPATPAPPSEPSAPAASKPEEEKKEPRIVRIPCPQGHELQTPTDMLNQEVLCPICNTQFHLRYEDSLEFKEEQAELKRRKAEELNQAALKWSIIAAIVVVLSIVGMIIYLAVRSPGEYGYTPPEPAEQAPAEATGPDAAGAAADDAKNVAE
ncbi:MAG TPA: hypothetical protein VG826_16055 [Pirellulales bacterium]|nr:hypothetical protein [Pirellulales bacterium]